MTGPDDSEAQRKALEEIRAFARGEMAKGMQERQGMSGNSWRGDGPLDSEMPPLQPQPPQELPRERPPMQGAAPPEDETLEELLRRTLSQNTTPEKEF